MARAALELTHATDGSNWFQSLDHHLHRRHAIRLNDLLLQRKSVAIGRESTRSKCFVIDNLGGLGSLRSRRSYDSDRGSCATFQQTKLLTSQHGWARQPQVVQCSDRAVGNDVETSSSEQSGTAVGHDGDPRWQDTLGCSEAGPSCQSEREGSHASESSSDSMTWKEGPTDIPEAGHVAPWFPVNPIWQASEHDALRDEHLRRLLAPAWRVLLLSDGSVTRHLQLLSDFGSVTADCFQMAEIGDDLTGLPPGAELVPGPRVQRQVWLRTSDGQPLVYAASWWSAREVRGYLKEVQKPIWVNLSETRAELYRDVQRLYLGHSDELERAFGVPGPFWSRHYVFYHDGRPLTLIYEVFSRSLEKYIGPMHPA